MGPIPACAGQPGVQCGPLSARRAYPRVCGATRQLCCIFVIEQGLSPRVRGNRERPQAHQLLIGPIPACAGQPGCPRIRGAAFGAYPRVCGATAILWLAHEKNLGLSPRVRGNLLPHPISWLLRGPIPACAGQPAPIIGGRRIARAYPRVCGATGQQRDVMVIVPGLSPRVRGNRQDLRRQDGSGWPIPACAGQPMSP